MQEITVSLVILTWNRRASVEHTLVRNLLTAAYPIHEIIHVDNGSLPGFCDWFEQRFKPSVQIRHKTNRGVAVGYNRGMALANGSHVVITGMDRIMPDRWLAEWVQALQLIPQTGVISCYINKPGIGFDYPTANINGIPIKQCHPMHARIHSKEFLFQTGFWREDFGLYGYEDAEWADRANKVARENNLINYMLPELGRAELLTCEDFETKVNGEVYWDFKQKLHSDPRRRGLMRWCKENGSPYYNPFYRVEENHFGKGV